MRVIVWGVSIAACEPEADTSENCSTVKVVAAFQH